MPFRPAVSSSPGKNPDELSVGVKRIRYLRPSEEKSFNYSNMSNDVSMSSESILEQMNQTEKRFLPDNEQPAYRASKKSKTGSTGGSNSNTGHSDGRSADSGSMRKRRASNLISMVEDEDPREKAGRFCTCTECYAEAAGVSSFIENTSTMRSCTPSRGIASGFSSQRSSIIGSPLASSQRVKPKMAEKGTETDIISDRVVVR